MSIIVTRSGKGTPLTNTEVDANFTNLNTDKAELSGSTFTGNLSLGDNVKLQLGNQTNGDLQIYHSGTHSYIKDAGTGNLNILASTSINLLNSDSSDYMARFNDNGSNQFFYDGDQKLATTSSGISVTGSVVADGLTVDGRGSINQGMTNGSVSAFTNPHLALKSTDSVDTTGFVGMSFATSDTVNYGFSVGAQRTSSGQGDLVVRNHFNSAQGTKKLSVADNGDISFYDGSGNQGLFWDSSTSSLGIGTTVPARPLTVNGLAGFRNSTTGFGTSDGFDIGVGGSDAYIVQRENADIIIETNGAERLRIKGDGSSVFSGAVTSTGLTVTKASGDIATLEGSGTTSNVQANLVFNPVYDVNARIVSARDGSGLFSRIAFETGVDNTGNTIQRLNIGSHGDISFYNTAGTSQNFFWDSSTSRLGLGTTVPTEKLHLQSSDVGSGSGEVAIKMTVPASQISAQNEIRSGVTSGTNPYMSFAVRETSAPYSTVEKLRINTDGSSVFSGSVTSTGLTVNGTGTMDDAVISGSNPTLTIYETDTTNLNTRFDNGGGDLYIQTVNDDGSNAKTRMLIDHATGDINLGYEDTGTTPKLFWDASAESLELTNSAASSALKVTKGNTTGNAVEIINSGESRSIDINHNADGTGIVDDVVRIKDNGTTKFVIDENYNVGIGTDSPTAPLTILSTGWEHLNLVSSNSNSTNKTGYVTVGHYTNAQESFGIISGQSTSSSNILNIGGGAAGLNAATSINLYTAANNTTVTGTPALTINASGLVSIKNNTAPTLRIENTDTGLTANETIGDIDFYQNDASGGGVGVVGKIRSINDSSFQGEASLAFHTGTTGGLTERFRISSDGSCRWTPDGTNHDMTLTADGNLLVGTTGFPSGTVEGIKAASNGVFSAAAAGTAPLALYRHDSDGNIVNFHKDGTNVGSIASDGGSNLIVKGQGNNAALLFNHTNARIEPYTNSVTDLGRSAAKFKDLYLSGGVYLGGTGAANKLDDYEEGTFTAVLGDGTNTINMPSATYTKIGRYVTISINLYNTDLSSLSTSGSLRITNLPFTTAASGPVAFATNNPTEKPIAVHPQGTFTYLWITSASAVDYTFATKATMGLGTGNASVRGTFHYQTT